MIAYLPTVLFVVALVLAIADVVLAMLANPRRDPTLYPIVWALLALAAKAVL